MARRSGFLRDDHGAVLVFVGIGLPMFLGMIALVYDIGLMRLHQTRLQIAADAAAVAAAQQAADPVAAEAAALRAADANYPQVLPTGGVQFVHWNATARAVEVADPGAGRPANAVSVVTRRDAGTNSVLPLVFARGAGVQGDGFSLSASAVALVATAPGCVAPSAVVAGNGFKEWKSKGASFTSLCLVHGNPGKMSKVEDGLRLVDSGVVVSGKTDDPLFQIPDDLKDSAGLSVRDTHGVSGTVDLDPVRNFLRAEIDEVKKHAGTPPSSWPLTQIKPSYGPTRYTNGDLEVGEGKSLCSNGVRNSCFANDPVTWHRVKGAVEIEEGADTIRNLVIWATKDIEIGEDVSLENVTLVTDGSVEIGEGARLVDVTILAASNVDLDEDVQMGAGGTAFDSYLFSGGNVTIGEKADFASVYVALMNEGKSGANLTLEEDGRFEGVTLVTSGWIEMEEGLTMIGRPRTTPYPVPAMPATGTAARSQTALVR